MPARKTHNLAVKVGSYQKDGQEKGRYVNVGSLMVNDDGSPFILMEKTFNPAGVPNTGDKESILISAFPVEAQAQPQQGYAPPQGQQYGNNGYPPQQPAGYQQPQGAGFQPPPSQPPQGAPTAYRPPDDGIPF